MDHQATCHRAVIGTAIISVGHAPQTRNCHLFPRKFNSCQNAPNRYSRKNLLKHIDVLNFTKSKSAEGWLSVAMGEGRADFVHVQRARDRLPRVLLAESIEHGGDVAATLSALRKPMKLAAYRCTALLPHGQYQMITTEALEGSPDEAREVTRWKIKDQVDFSVDTAAIDLLPIPGDGRNVQTFVVISPEATIAPLVQAFQAAKVPLAAIDVPELSQRNIAALFEEENRGLATLIFDQAEGLLTFTMGGELLVVRHVEIPVRQLISADAERRNMLFERIALDVQRSLDNFDRNFSHVQLSRMIVAPIPGVEGFVDYLAGNLAVAVAPVDISAALDFGAVPALLDPVRQFHSLRAIGAALRDEAGT
jgi:MSHA biogenesis protein MshI